MSEATRNTVSGGAYVGTAVQAGAIHTLHLHAPLPALAAPTPRQLARPVVPFVDRTRDEALIRDVLDRHVYPVVLIVGPGGIGKTALAERILRERSAPADAILAADLHAGSIGGPARPEAVLARWLRALGRPGPWLDLEDSVAQWRSATADGTVAVLLDNADSAHQVRPLLPAAGTAVVTSRALLADLVLDGAVHHQLGPLPEPAAVELLRHLAGGRLGGEAGLQRVAADCGGKPLPLRLAALRPQAPPSAPPAHGGSQLPSRAIDMDVITVHFDASYSLVSSPARDLLRAAGTIPLTQFDTGVMAAVLDADAARVRESIAELRAAGLLIGEPGERWTGLVPGPESRGAAADLAIDLDRPALRAEQVRRALEAILAYAGQVERILTPHHRTDLTRTFQLVDPASLADPITDENAAHAWLEWADGQVETALAAAVEHDHTDLQWQLVHALWPLWHHHRDYRQWLAALAIAERAARISGNPLAHLEILNNHGVALRGVGRFEDAIAKFRASQQLAAEIGDDRARAQNSNAIGSTLERTGRRDEAEPYLTEALELRTALGDVRGCALTRLLLARCAAARGEHAEALELLDAARIDLLAEGDALNAAGALANKGRVLAGDGQFELAQSALLMALAEAEECRARGWVARCHLWMADIAREQGATALEADRLERALDAHGFDPVTRVEVEARLAAVRAVRGDADA
ncbi:tetratricopeptide repeat protein [Kitasatospora sp. NPDC088783]|uniref:tetratricopeptide repeat protein n=1 Tax=Kitasatospora sp. NPDC088783 TaxID=3364077 RepID=UPI003812670B